MTERDLETQLGPALARHFAAEDRARCPREVELGRFAAEDLDPRERAEFEGHLEECAECREELRLFRLEPAPVPARTARELRPLAWIRRFSEGWSWGLGAGLAAAAAVLVAVVGPALAPQEDVLVAKGAGSFELAVAAVRGGRSFRVGEAASLEPGDQLGFFYSAAEPGFLMVLDASPAEIARIFPAQQDESLGVETARDSPLPDGAVLGAGAGCEWIVGLYSSRPFTEPQARAWLEPMIAGREGCRLAPSGAAEVEARAVTVRR